MNYNSIYEESMVHSEIFWKEQASKLSWYNFPKTILSINEYNYAKWFEDGKINACYLSVDKHIEDGFGNQTAIIFDSPVTQTKNSYTFYQVKEQVAKLAGGLLSLGVNTGDTVIIYMPMIPQAIFAMLACARIGVTHSVVFGGFAPHELAIRIDDCLPKVIITASSGIEIDRIISYKPLVDEAINLATHKPFHTIIFNRKQGCVLPINESDIDYEKLVSSSNEAFCVPVNGSHPLYILYTSGTTGKPKGIVRDTGGYCTALLFSMQNIYGVKKGEVFWAASDVGWVVGHSYIVYGPLLNRNTTILFEGKPIKTPNAGTFWRIIEEYKVAVMFTAPTAIRAIKKEDIEANFIKKHDLSSLRFQFLAGERCDITTLEWLSGALKIPVIDHWWQTESGWPMLANMAGIEIMPIKPGSAGKPVCGFNIQILDQNGKKLDAFEEGYIAIQLPLPPGMMLGLWNDFKRFKEGYLDKFKNYYFTGDGGYKDEEGYIYVTGRVDDVINVAGHRLSTAEMEEIVASHPLIAECAVVGIHDEIKGQVPVALLILKTDFLENQELISKEVCKLIRDKIGAIASLKDVIFTNKLPKTRSGKIVRKLIRQIIDNQELQIPSTIEDLSVIEELKNIVNTKYKNIKIN